MHDQTLVVAVQHQRPELSIILVQQLDAKLRSPYSSVLSDVFPESMSLKPEPFTAGSFPLLQDQSTTNHNEIIELKLFISFLDQMNQDITCLW